MSIPLPGSNAAVALGCTCPVIDNGHGAGRGCDGPRLGWIIDLDCPIHGGALYWVPTTGETVSKPEARKGERDDLVCSICRQPEEAGKPHRHACE